MNTLPNPSGCLSVRHRIYRAPRITLLQRIACLIAGGSAAWAEQLDYLGSQT